MTDDDQHAVLRVTLGQVRYLLEQVPLMPGERPWNRDEKVEAVNELDMLIDKLAAAEKERDEANSECSDLSSDVTNLRIGRDVAQRDLDAAEEKIAELEARVNELKARPENNDLDLALIREFQRDTAQV